MPTCNRCNTEKSDSEFYTKDKTCKVCRRALVRANRYAKHDYYLAYDRRRFHENRERRERSMATSRAYKDRQPIKRSARIAVGTAIDAGRLVRQPCEVCGSAKSEAHHDDYSKPLDVRWLCRRHHMELHRKSA